MPPCWVFSLRYPRLSVGATTTRRWKTSGSRWRACARNSCESITARRKPSRHWPKPAGADLMNFIKTRKRKVPSVIIVSLIDVLLVVLIFLMVSTTFKHEQPALKLALPESKVAKPGPADNNTVFVVSVSTNFPYFFIGEKAVTIDQLQKELD